MQSLSRRRLLQSAPPGALFGSGLLSACTSPASGIIPLAPIRARPDRIIDIAVCTRPFRAAVIEQCTYDGTIYSAEEVLRRIGHLCDYILFDEAWAGFMKFHPLYAGRFAMGLADLGKDSPGVIATQSTHKQLASFSQASQIHVKDHHIEGQRRRIEHRRFNEFFMLHASTSPFYPLFASLDVGARPVFAATVEQRAGRRRVRPHVRLARLAEILALDVPVLPPANRLRDDGTRLGAGARRTRREQALEELRVERLRGQGEATHGRSIRRIT